MILSDKKIKELISKGEIKIERKEGELYIGPSSIDLHLSGTAKLIDFPPDGIIDTYDKNSIRYRTFEFEELIIQPGDFFLLSTEEKITLSKSTAGFVSGRSSMARVGVNVHCAGFVDPQFSGTITMEVSNFTNYPIKLHRGMRLCQIVILLTTDPVEIGYGEKKDSKYQNQIDPGESKIYKDNEI